MIMNVFAVYDAAVQAFLPPFFARSKGEAIRSFSEACNDEKHQFKRHAADYSLFELGAFDDSSGGLERVVAPVRVLSALECIVQDVVSESQSAEGNGVSRRRMAM